MKRLLIALFLFAGCNPVPQQYNRPFLPVVAHKVMYGDGLPMLPDEFMGFCTFVVISRNQPYWVAVAANVTRHESYVYVPLTLFGNRVCSRGPVTRGRATEFDIDWSP